MQLNITTPLCTTDDPTETTNLAADPAYADQVDKMKKYILKKLEQYRQAPDDNLAVINLAGDPKQHGGNWVTGWCEDYVISMQ